LGSAGARCGWFFQNLCQAKTAIFSDSRLN
jgi:hypothetical protein